MKTSKGFAPIIAIVIVLVVGLAAGAVIYFTTRETATNANNNTNQAVTNENVNLNQNANLNSNTNAAADETADWETYESIGLGLSFKYPPSLGSVTITYPVAPVPNLQTGKKILGSFSGNSKVYFTGTTPDYSYPSAGGIDECQGYYETILNSNTVYYFRFPTKPSDSYPIEPLKVIKTINSYSLLINANSFVKERGIEGDLTFANLLGENNSAGIVNLWKGEFRGLVFVNRDTKNFTEESFELMLSTIKAE